MAANPECRHRDDGGHQYHGDDGLRGRQPEEVVIVEVLSDESRDRKPDRATDSEGRTDEGDRAAERMEPPVISSRSTSTTRRLPIMSPRRPLIGVEIAAASRVDVRTQVASAGVVLRKSGSRGMIGVTRVCMKAAINPARASVVVIGRSLGQ